jgi:hypothetical protein
VPVHSCLSNFRAKINGELFYTILFDLIAQALKLKDFLLPMLTGIDSRPIWANVNGYKHKRCSCQDQNKCACEKTYSDPDATCGVQPTKANQNKFFIGYRKHSIVCPSPKGPIVLFSIILPNDTADVKVMLPLIEMMKKIEGLKVDYLVADLGYFDADDQKEALLQHDVAVVTEIKKNTSFLNTAPPKGNRNASKVMLLCSTDSIKIHTPLGFAETMRNAPPVRFMVFARGSLAIPSRKTRLSTALYHRQACCKGTC